MNAEDKLKKRQSICQFAQTLLGIPYCFGAKQEDLNVIPKEIDCSGFIRYVYRKCGIEIPDGSYNQYNFCHRIPTYDELQIGDLGFFINDKDGVHHVFMLFDDLKTIEARGEPYHKVIFRPRIIMQDFYEFGGWRVHPDLI